MRLTGTYDRKGDCEKCGKSATRSKSFSGATMSEVEQQADAWAATRLFHARCEVAA